MKVQLFTSPRDADKWSTDVLVSVKIANPQSPPAVVLQQIVLELWARSTVVETGQSNAVPVKVGESFSINLHKKDEWEFSESHFY